ncbi:MAG: hypothetical protein LBL96_00380 [Clostridiales bacterium]|jgi:hypothetical protein|nr:hypothetical protein [Clostridiales bacterium]
MKTIGIQRGNAANYIAVMVIVLAVIWQGGFSDMSWGIFGAIFAAGAILTAKKLPPKPITLLCLLLVSLYIISALLHGAHFESLVQVEKLFTAILALTVIYNLKNLNIATVILLSGIIAAILGIATFLGIIDFAEASFEGRLQGTFRYANAAGIFFAVCAFITRTYIQTRKKHIAFVFELVLLLTQSIGAIATYLLAWMLYLFVSKKWKVFLSLLGVSVSGGVVLLYIRGANQIVASYLDRLIQISDGTVVMLHNPLGIGPGLWGLRVLELQSAFYSSAKMHSYLVEIGVDAGMLAIVAFGLLIAIWIRRIRESGLLPRHIAAIMLLFHGLVDITFGFLSLIILLVLLIAPDFANGIPLNKYSRYAGGMAAIIFCGFITARLGLYNLEMWENQGVAPESVVAEYMRDELKTALDEYRYAKALLYLGRYTEAADSAIQCIQLARYLPDGYELLDSILLNITESEREKYSLQAEEIRVMAEQTEHPLYKYLLKYKNNDFG